MKASRRLTAVTAAAVAAFVGATFSAPAQAYPPGQGIVVIGNHTHAVVNQKVTFTARKLKPGASVLIKLVGTTKGKTVKADDKGVAVVTLSPEKTGSYLVIAKAKNETTGRTKLYVPSFSYELTGAAPAGSKNTFLGQDFRPYVFVTFRINGNDFRGQSNSKGNVQIKFTMPSKKKTYNPPVFINTKWLTSGHENTALRIIAN